MRSVDEKQEDDVSLARKAGCEQGNASGTEDRRKPASKKKKKRIPGVCLIWTFFFNHLGKISKI
jgi:hypothetical protein